MSVIEENKYTLIQQETTRINMINESIWITGIDNPDKIFGAKPW